MKATVHKVSKKDRLNELFQELASGNNSAELKDPNIEDLYNDAIIEIIDLNSQNAYLAGQVSILSKVVERLLPGFKMNPVQKCKGCSDKCKNS